MIQSKTGGGKLSSKLLTILMVAMPLVAFAQAQNASTGPNKVYIEQIGSTNTITIEQVGGSNNIGGNASLTPSSSNYGTISGSNNVLAMIQTGDANTGQYGIKGGANLYTSTVTGSNNQTRLSIGDLNNNSMRNTVTETVIGNTNKVDTTIVANDVVSTIAITGNTNEVTSVLRSNRGVSDISISGSNNQLDIQQIDAAGANGHLLKQVITGDYNTIVTQQQGTNDTTVDLKTTGDHNTITIRTSSASILTPKTAVAR
jgi:hypothetical protein